MPRSIILILIKKFKIVYKSTLLSSACVYTISENYCAVITCLCVYTRVLGYVHIKMAKKGPNRQCFSCIPHQSSGTGVSDTTRLILWDWCSVTPPHQSSGTGVSDTTKDIFLIHESRLMYCMRSVKLPATIWNQNSQLGAQWHCKL